MQCSSAQECSLPLFPGYDRIRHLLVTNVPLGMGISNGKKAVRVLLHEITKMESPLAASKQASKQASSRAIDMSLELASHVNCDQSI